MKLDDFEAVEKSTACVDGGASSPARCRASNFQFEPWQFRPTGETAESIGFCASCHPYHNLLEFSKENSGRKLRKEDIFLPGNEISLQKNIANPPRMSPDLILRAVLRIFLTICAAEASFGNTPVRKKGE